MCLTEMYFKCVKNVYKNTFTKENVKKYIFKKIKYHQFFKNLVGIK